MKVRIRNGSMVGQDFGYHEWRDNGTVFEATKVTSTQFKCVAPGYGKLSIPNSYGNGALYVKKRIYSMQTPFGEIEYGGRKKEVMSIANHHNRWMSLSWVTVGDHRTTETSDFG